MKTKLIILTAAAAVLLYSCSNDRDEEVRKDAIEKVKASNQNLKLNQPSAQSREGESTLTSDTIRIRSSNDMGLGIPPEDPDETIDPTKPDKPW
ncbi:hypothetical protein KBP46_10165 [Chryseobacterium sp. PCH239]|uniref:hypothetical protein n=1 Tax=Chryseobacterium sp. PCH239 TaxID=2825845 RepID=UPI001C1086ED|nr:hypothetical protein [Chryseobacterium sp. PCH239]QWT88161.1 hypothetical protein KBP46_10165 [Chryseobacterium sp. PCH239]